LHIENRRVKAAHYFQTVLQRQRDWRSAKAGAQKSWHLFFAIPTIVLEAVISCPQAIEA
jgi:hypothetical protein